ncbi:hypothetical protein [Wielerella bovis]|uniref:hypothetical protein n=1 Tax=Wielerella bovis TaxID=2917790 RepID=UPI0020185959|nr:hypothetical protein [Wielerella bovis]MCG7655951.1 hypothetical protein [Wielerella bovis]MCG7655974.1 hypothetical protein [Wielerella bovis]MCG7656860.1 hypothetical protein [Wielerella bovis]MCG7658132.1 hypothetical protein [Wielerella bovis]MCG7658200.1 hypothetical protein [Wielerella bovis]
MNLFKQLNVLFAKPTRSVAKITHIRSDGTLEAETVFGKNQVLLRGQGFAVGQSVFYDTKTGQVLESAPNVGLVEMDV